MRRISHIVIHCTATPMNTTVGSIERYWREKLGWKAPGYHKVVQADGTVVTLAPDERICNGVAGHNSGALHLSYIGGIDGKGRAFDTRTPAQTEAMIQVVADWKMKYPEAEVLGHRDFPGVKKECPSFPARRWWAFVSQKVLILLPVILLALAGCSPVLRVDSTESYSITTGQGDSLKTVDYEKYFRVKQREQRKKAKGG